MNDRPATFARWCESLLAADWDTLTWLVLLLIAPLAWRVPGRRVKPAFQSGRSATPAGQKGVPPPDGQPSLVRGFAWSLVIFLLSLSASAFVGREFDSLPPAYHDEYSYLFQARTFLAGRASFPSHSAARLFDQMHVLNEGRFASRYFPGTGLWMAPFVAWEHPWWGHWLAGALCAVLIFWTGRELGGEACGVISGLLTAASPDMALFSNLLLAHHPTLVGLGLFLLGYFRCVARQSPFWGAVAGVGLAFAAVCRPMTAFGVALPFGVSFLVWLAHGARPSAEIQADRKGPRARLRLIVAMGLPLLAAGGAMFLYDRAITGSGWETPYSAYTKVYTPRHVYGFNNGVRGEQHRGPRVIRKYDDWAENLTRPLAVENIRRRGFASWRWTLGLVPLTLALVAGICLWSALPDGSGLILASILSLHAVHIPYWFVGMQDHHYVFEAVILWCLWIGLATVAAARAWVIQGRAWMPVWWGTALCASVALNYTGGSTLWSAPLAKAQSEVRFARAQHGRFAALISAAVRSAGPALVLVEPDPADVHIDHVTNAPSLDDDVLIGHYVPDVVPLAEIERLFPNRSVWLYSARNRTISRLR
ncbi:MAG: hypothetical protein ACT4QC_21985 [Planctomycetaceae bacterium]